MNSKTSAPYPIWPKKNQYAGRLSEEICGKHFHDFRSLLNSIKGYAEAIMDGTIPTDMQDKYLGIIVDETERLNKLTSGAGA